MPHRLLFITDRFPPQPGGASVSAARLTHGLAARGHVVHVLHLGAEEVPAGALQSARDGQRVLHRLGALETPDLALQLAETLLDHLHARVDFTLAHGHALVPAAYLATLCARRWGIPAVASVRGNDLDRGLFRADHFPFIRWTLEHAGAVGCVSRALSAKARAAGATRVHDTPNSVDAALFAPAPPDLALLRAYALEGKAVLGFTGELRFKKGTAFMLEAFREVAAAHPAALLLVGTIREEDHRLLRHFLRRHPALRPDVHLIDYLQDRAQLARLYHLMDVVLAPSLWDGMPNSVLEAMACARVVCAADVGGIADVIAHGDTGALIGVHELHRLGEACRELLALPAEERAAMGQRARACVEARHSPAGELDRLEAIYATLAGNSDA